MTFPVRVGIFFGRLEVVDELSEADVEVYNKRPSIIKTLQGHGYGHLCVICPTTKKEKGRAAKASSKYKAAAEKT